MGVVRVLIADDQRLTLEAMKDALSGGSGAKVVAETASGSRALDLVQKVKPDVALIEMYLRGAVDGLTCAERIRRSFPDVRVVVTAAITDESNIRAAFRRGAHAFISKAVDPRDLAPALRQIVQGTVFHLPMENGVGPPRDLPEGLTNRQVAVVKLVAAGMPNLLIARELGVTEHTVKFHLTRIFRALNVANRTELARWAHSHGLVEDIPVGGLQFEPLTDLVEPLTDLGMSQLTVSSAKTAPPARNGP